MEWKQYLELTKQTEEEIKERFVSEDNLTYKTS